MRNPNRTTKRQRRDARRYAPFIARTIGTAEAARLFRDGIILDEATGLRKLARAALADHLGDAAGFWGRWTLSDDIIARATATVRDGPPLVPVGPRDGMMPMPPVNVSDYWRSLLIDGEWTASDGETKVVRDHRGDYRIQDVHTTDTTADLIDEYGFGFDDQYAIAYDTAPVEEITEVRADSPDLPEALRPVVEEFVNARNADPSDYTVAYRSSELDGDTADVLIMPKWEHGGVLEDYARLHGTPPRVDLGTAPVGAPPFNTVQYDNRGANPHMPYPFEPHLELYRGDPNERDAARAEAIDHALANDYTEDEGDTPSGH